jgi:NADPH:quinone reductase-like Zn-dependent oxidoreductase
MKAIIQDRYGPPQDVLLLQDVDRPNVSDDEVLVRVHASAAAGDDWHLVRGLPYVARMVTGLLKPKNRIPGRDVAGVVKAVGRNVTQFGPGDGVFGWCEGAFAEYATASEDWLALKPSNLTFEQAAVVPISGFTALQAVGDTGRLQPGQQVLIIGASGGVGTFAVQIAKSLGATVVGVCSTGSVDLVRSIGADRVVDYTQEDFTRDGQRYDLIVDMVGARSLADTRRVLSPAGTLVMVGSSGGRWFKGTDRWAGAVLMSPFVRQRLRPLVHTDRKDDLVVLKQLIEARKVTPVISAQYPLSRVAEAISHFEEGHARGKVVIMV